MDYNELAIHNEVAAVWPSTTRRGCNFHYNYKKALLKHVKQTNIWEEYLRGRSHITSFRNPPPPPPSADYVICERPLTPNSPVREFFAMTGAIDYLPETDVARIWRHLKPNLPIDMAEFASYYENTWIGISTTCPKPTIWMFLTDVKKTKRDGREVPEPCAPKWIRYDQQLQIFVSTSKSNEKTGRVQLRSYYLKLDMLRIKI